MNTVLISRKRFVGGLAAAFGGLILPADAFVAGTPLLRFGLVSDVHLGGEGKDADLEKVLRFFDAQGVDAVMIPGDIAHTGLIKEFERFAAIWYRVFPNDRGSDGRVDPARRMLQCRRGLRRPSRRASPRCADGRAAWRGLGGSAASGLWKGL